MSSRRCHTYQPCDTFFVESYGGFPAPGLDLKQHAKLVARQRQYAIKDELSRIASDEFREDILAHLLEMDVSFPPYPALRIDLDLTNWFSRTQLFLMWSPSIFKPKSSGLCVRTFWTS